MVGSFTSPAWNIDVSPIMTFDEDCALTVLVRFGTPGIYIFKFVTEGAFDDDFGGTESDTLDTSTDHPVQIVTGTGNGLTLRVLAAGCYRVRLFEDRKVFRADPAGCSSGGIRGVVAFENVSQPPLPRAYVRASKAGVVAASDSSKREDGSFLLSGLDSGAYEVIFKGFGYRDTTIAGVQVEKSVVAMDTTRLRAGCVSAYDSIQVVGEMTNPVWTIKISPPMQQVEGCRWQAHVSVPAGAHKFKLVTNGVFDNPPDYGGDETRLLNVDSTYAVRPVTGQGTALNMLFPFTGAYDFEFNEEALTLRVSPGDIPGDLAGIVVFEGVRSKPFPVALVRVLRSGVTVASDSTSATDGSFLVARVDAGLYDVRLEPPLGAPTHRDTTLTGIPIAGGATNLGQVYLSRATGSLNGTAGFSDVVAPPYPPAAVDLRLGGELAASLRTTAASPAFQTTGLKPGTYTVRVASTGYVDSTFAATVGTGTTDIGTITLPRLVCAAYPSITLMQLGGREFDQDANDLTFTWNLGDAPMMDHVDQCRWEISVPCRYIPPVRKYRIKFLTNRSYGGDPPDFGGDDTSVIPPDSLVGVVETPDPDISHTLVVRISDPGVYRFTLDLDALSFSFTRTGDLPAPRPRLARRSR
jgi:hypothetical protein